MVSDLLSPALASWNESLVQLVFLPFDAEAILKIPVCTRNTEDFWAWNPDRKGRFTVSSAYKLLVTTKVQREAWLDGRADSSSNAREGEAWSRLWQLKVPSKVRVFLWRLARHSIPTTDVLHRRNMATQSACPLCGCQDSWRHALLSCTMSRCVWALVDESLVSRTGNEEANAKSWLFELHETLDHVRFTRMVVTLWAVWYARRKAIYESLFQNPHQTVSFVDSYLQELQQIPSSKQKVQVFDASG